MKLFTVQAAHYHPDDNAHDPKFDLKRYLVVDEDWKSAKARIAPNFGAAWRLTKLAERDLIIGMIWELKTGD